VAEDPFLRLPDDSRIYRPAGTHPRPSPGAEIEPSHPIMFFDDFQGLIRVFVISIVAYAALVVFLRISGKRTLTKLNAFDLVVTVALGSMLATIVLSKDVALAEGMLALFMLIALQFVVTWLSVHMDGFLKAVKSEPRVLVRHGEWIDRAMKDERVNRKEVLAAVRAEGKIGIEGIGAVILETDGSLSVIPGDELDGDGIDFDGK
jgi:uncharacterized membrane protein YcaP (DUF421 family)